MTISLWCCIILSLTCNTYAFNDEQRKYIDGTIEPVDNTVSKPETICIMTRDNICLSTTVYLPSTGTTFSAVYAKTPYGKSSLSGTGSEYNKQGYAVLAQDCRGRHASNGSYSFWRTSGNDTIDTIKWMMSQTWSDGLLSFTGVSADALAQYADITGVTQGGGGENGFNEYNEILNRVKFGYLIWGDGLGKQTAYQDGAYRTGLISGWLDLILEPGMVHTVLENEAFNPWWYPLVGAYQWDPINHKNEAQWGVANLSILHSSGWYDIFSNNQIKTALNVNVSGQINAVGKQMLLIDPGGHCGGGAIKWPNGSYGANIVSSKYGPALFKGAFDAAKENKLFVPQDFIPWNVMFYMLGPGLKDSEGNYWVQGLGLPPATNTSYYMDGSTGSLSTTKVTKDGSQSYLFNPKNPVGTHGGNNLILEPCGPQSQEKNEKGRTDILHYTSEELKENVYLVGEIFALLYVGSDAIDTDFTAKVIDIFPDGTPMLVQDGIQRMRWRNGPYATEVAPKMVPGQVYEILLEVGYMGYIFNSGHKISLSVSSSNSKRFSVNYNNGNFVVDGDKDYKVANNTVYFGGGQYPSALILPIVEKQWLHDRKIEL